MLKRIQLNSVISGLFVLFSLFFLLESMKLDYWSSQYAPGPGFIPRWASGAMSILSIIAFISSFREKSDTLAELLPKEKGSRINLYICWGGLLFFVLFVKQVGFLPTSFIYLSALFSRGTSWKKAIPIAAVVVIACFVIFKIFLRVQIPTNRFGW